VTAENKKLDAEELLHLALESIKHNDHEKAITLLKNSIEVAESGNAYFMLAAEHAEIGMYDRAIVEMQKAVELDPELWTAHLQHGLLYVRLNQPDAAIAAWEPLNQLANDEYLYLFKAGLTELLKENFEDAEKLLMEGITSNQSNLPLNGDMQRIIMNIRTATQPQNSEEETKSDPEMTDDSDDNKKTRLNEVLLNKYKK
jgi:tetratricopeptide (TPR) repeat protein